MNKNISPLPKKICLVRLSALGDIVLALPLVKTLQENIPSCEISWIISKSLYPIVEHLPEVNFIPIEKPSNPLHYWRLYQRLQHEHFDVLLALQASFRANLIYPLISAPLKIGFDKFRAKDCHQFFINQAIAPGKQHLLDSFLAFAKALGITQLITRSYIPIAEEVVHWAKQQLPCKPILAINPSASKSERNWFIEDYVTVIHEAVKRWQVNIVLTGGPSEQEQLVAEKIVKQVQMPIYNYVAKTSLKQLAAILANVDVLLAPDTGPAHIANAVGTPVVGLFAVAPPELSAAYHSQHLVINKYPEAVKHILKKELDKLPWATRVHTQKAMQLIKPEEVLQKLATVFEKNDAHGNCEK